jgi:transcription antitermination factor NusG
LPNDSAWYAIWTKSHCERLVAQQLAGRGFTAFLPEAPAHRAGRTSGTAPIFPGYLFVHDTMDKQRYIDVLQVRGIVRVLEDGWTRLTPIPDAEIDAIQRIVDAGVPLVPYPLPQHGDTMRVVNGPLCGVAGRFLHEGQRRGRLVVSVHLLGRSVAVDMDMEDVEPCH